MSKLFRSGLFASLVLMLFSSCATKEEALPGTDASIVKSFDFNIESGNNCRDGGFVLIVKKDYTAVPSFLKMSATGTIEWEYKPDSILIDGIKQVPVLQAGCQLKDGYLMVGTISNKGSTILYIRKLNNFGSFLWEKSIPKLFLTECKILGLKSGDVVITGMSNDPSSSLTFGIVNGTGTLYVTAAGENKWIDTTKIASHQVKPFAIIESAYGVIVGLRNPADPTNNALIEIKEWFFNGQLRNDAIDTLPKNIYTAIATGLILTPDNNIIVSGYADVSTTSLYNFDFWVQKIGWLGTEIQELSFNHAGDNKQNICSASLTLNSGQLAFFGGTNYEAVPPGPYPDKVSSMYLVKTDVSGKVLYSRNFCEKLGTMGLLLNQNNDNTFNMLGVKQAYGNRLLLHTLFIRTLPDANF
jgi:hypothetical protein